MKRLQQIFSVKRTAFCRPMAVAVVLALLLTCLPLGVFSSAYSEELIVGGDFGASLDDWYTEGAVSISDAACVLSGADGQSTLQSVSAEAAAEKDYTVSFSVRLSENAAFSASVLQRTADGSSLAGDLLIPVPASAKSGDWETVSYTFRTAADVAELAVSFEVTAGTAELDDVSLKLTHDLPAYAADGESLPLKNGDFSMRLNGWESVGDTSVISGWFGKAAALMPQGGNASLAQGDLLLESDALYELHYYIKAANADNTAAGAEILLNENGVGRTIAPYVQRGSTAANGWQEVTVQFETGAVTGLATLRLKASGGSEDTLIGFDEITLVKLADGVTMQFESGASENLIHIGDAATVPKGTTYAATATGFSFTNGTAAKVNGASWTHNIAWESGKTYIVSYKAKTSAGATALIAYPEMQVGGVQYNHSKTATDIGKIMADAGVRIGGALSDWTAYSYEFTVPAGISTTTNNYLRFVANLGAGESIEYREVSVTLKADTPIEDEPVAENNLYTNGEFSVDNAYMNVTDVTMSTAFPDGKLAWGNNTNATTKTDYKVVADPTVGHAFYVQGTESAKVQNLLQHKIPWEDGKTYIISFKYKTTDTASSSNLDFYGQVTAGISGSTSTQRIGDRVQKAVTEWTTVTQEYTAPIGLIGTSNYFRFVISLAADAGLYLADVSVVEKIEPEHWLDNGNFTAGADGTGHWNGITSSNLVDGTVAGAQSGKALTVTAIATTNIFYKTFTKPVEPGKTYTLSFRARNNALSSMELGSVYFTKADGSGKLAEIKLVASNGVWSDYLLDFVAEAGYEHPRLVLDLAENVTYTFADFAFGEYVKPLSNPDFSEGLTDWKTNTVVGNAPVVSVVADAEYGKVLQVVKPKTDVNYTDISHAALAKRLILGKTYTFSYYTKASSGLDADAKHYPYYRKAVGSGAAIPTAVYEAQDNGWTKVTFDMTVTSGFENLIFAFRMMHRPDASTDTTTYWFANVTIEENRTPDKAAVGVNNGDFALTTGTYPNFWGGIGGNPTVESGVISLPENGGVSTVATVYGGSKHQLTFRVKADATARANFELQLTAYQDSNRTLVATNPTGLPVITLQDTDDWQDVEVLFTAPDGAEYADLSFLCSAGRLQLADVVLQLEGEAQLNFNFELGDKTPLSWSYSGTGVFARAKEGVDGKYAAKLTNAKNGRLTGSSFKLEGGAYYELSFWVKADMAFDAHIFPTVQQKTADGSSAHSCAYISNPDTNYRQITGSITFPWVFRVYGSTDWRFVRVHFRAADDAATGFLQISLNGESTMVLVDNLRLAKYDNTQTNMDFEIADEDGNLAGWYLGEARDVAPVFKQDTTRYHSGKASAYLKLDSTLKETHIISSNLLPIKATDSSRIYEFSFWVSSRNADIKSIRMDLWFFDKDGVKLYANGVGVMGSNIVGTIKTLNGSGEISEWSQVITRVQVPEKVGSLDVDSVSLVFMTTYGEAEMWIDDLFFDQVEDDSSIVVEHNDFHAKDQDGNIGGWTVEGGTLTQEYDSKDGFYFGRLNGGVLNYPLTTLATEYQYAMTVRYKSDSAINVEMTFADYKGNVYGDATTQYTLPASADWRQEEIRFTAPSATRANIAFSSKDASRVLDVSQLVVYQTGKPVTEIGWTGSWIGYSYNARTADEYDMSYYRYRFELEDEVTYAPFQITGDDNYTLYINGTEVFSNIDAGLDIWSVVQVLDIAPYLKKGENIIAVKLYNHGAYSALIFDGIWELANGETFTCVSDENTVCLNPDPVGDWTAVDYDDSAWQKSVVYGDVPLTPWGQIFFDSSLYIDNLIDVRVNEGEGVLVNDLLYEFSIDIKLQKALESQLPFSMVLWRKNSVTSLCNLTPTFLENGDMTKWPVDKWFTVKMRVELPDYIADGNYTLQLSDSYFLIDNESIFENKFISFKVVNDYVATEAESSVEMINGSPTLVVNGEPKPAFLFHSNTFDRTLGLDTINKSGIETYIGVSTRIMAYNDKEDLWQESGAFNFSGLDSNIADLLNASPEANIIVTIGMWAPSWWIKQNPDEVTISIDANGVETKHAYASWGSEKWKEDGGMVIKEIIAHMREQDYYSRVVGVRLTAGRTSEFMHYGTDSGDIADYSPAALSFYRKWLKEKYGTVEALREAWNGYPVASFDTVEMPTFDELKQAGEWGDLYDPATQQRMIDFRLLLDEMTTDSMLYWAKCVKEATDNKLVVGAYYGYIFLGGAWSTIGTMHTSFQKAMQSEYLDFFCSPAGYNEKQLGESSYTQAATDSIRAYGKLIITEQDNRTVLTSQFAGTNWDTPRDFSVGTTHTMENTLLQEKRDVVANIAAGNGQWLFDMQGGWLDDDQIYEFTNDVNDEYNFFNYIDKDLQNDVALIIPDTYPAYYVADGSSSVVVAQFMYQYHRKILARIGTGYDVYALSTLVDGKMPQHKINVFLTPYMLTAVERDAIDKYCKNNGQYNVFLYKSGIGDEDGNDLANMEELTGFTFGMTDRIASGQITITDNNAPLTSGLAGERFGAMVSTALYLDQEYYVIPDADTAVLGVNSDSGKAGLTMKEMDDWTSIYCYAPHLSIDIYRNLLAMADVHIYTEDRSDIVWSNSAYVGVTSPTAGEKHIQLPATYAVYDVFEEKMISLSTDVITYTNRENDTHLFRLTPVNTYSLLAMVKGGHGTVSASGLEYVAPGSNRTLTFKPDDGYTIKSVTVNGKEQTLSAEKTLTLTDIRENITIVVKYKRVPCTRTLEPETPPTEKPEEKPNEETPEEETPEELPNEQLPIDPEKPMDEPPAEESPLEDPEDPLDTFYEEEWDHWEWRIDFAAWQVVLIWTGIIGLIVLIVWLKRRHDNKKKEADK
ncbi:MAG: carbohydrate binding domain-containing protein [Clostridia bacterium]|nr:carbohydrate binding domain-containing protein [Clostridia bacterium]